MTKVALSGKIGGHAVLDDPLVKMTQAAAGVVLERDGGRKVVRISGTEGDVVRVWGETPRDKALLVTATRAISSVIVLRGA
jgi:phosphoglucomutase